MDRGTAQPAILIRLRPKGPWRYGPGDGAQDRVDLVYRSDRVFSAVTVAMQQLGFIEEWLEATARANVPAVAFSSLYPYQGDTLFATPPTTVWPPAANQLSAPNPAFLGKIRWTGVQLVPVTVIETLLNGRTVPADQWVADAGTGCLLRRDRPGSAPFRVTARNTAAVDRVTRSAIQVSSTACVEFEPDAGLWTVARFSDGAAASAWQERVQACFRLLADSGFGGRRTQGWGKADVPDFRRGTWPNVILPRLNRNGSGDGAGESSLYWMLSLYSPASTDAIDWSAGDYRLTVRGGRAENGALKKSARMIAEGSVLSAQQEPSGMAVDVSPENYAHPVYRSGLALALKLPVITAPSDLAPVETPADEEALEPRPCAEPTIEIAAAEETTEGMEPKPPETSPVEDSASEDLTNVEGDQSTRSGESVETSTSTEGASERSSEESSSGEGSVNEL